MTLKSELNRLINEEIGSRDENDDIPRKQRFQVAQKFGAVVPEFDRVTIVAPKKAKTKKYFVGMDKTGYALHVTKPFWMDDNEDEEMTWQQKNQNLQEVVSYVVKQIRREQNALRPRTSPGSSQPITQRPKPSAPLPTPSLLPRRQTVRKFQHPNSTRTSR